MLVATSSTVHYVGLDPRRQTAGLAGSGAGARIRRLVAQSDRLYVATDVLLALGQLISQLLCVSDGIGRVSAVRRGDTLSEIWLWLPTRSPVSATKLASILTVNLCVVHVGLFKLVFTHSKYQFLWRLDPIMSVKGSGILLTSQIFCITSSLMKPPVSIPFRS